jgi:hypothetical protein
MGRFEIIFIVKQSDYSDDSRAQKDSQNRMFPLADRDRHVMSLPEAHDKDGQHKPGDYCQTAPKRHNSGVDIALPWRSNGFIAKSETFDKRHKGDSKRARKSRRYQHLQDKIIHSES